MTSVQNLGLVRSLSGVNEVSYWALSNEQRLLGIVSISIPRLR